MSKEDLQQRIDDYLLGRSSREDRLELEEEMTRDAALSEQLADTELAMAAIELAEDQAMKARLRGLEASLRNAGSTAEAAAADKPAAKVVKMQARQRSRMNLLGIAAAVLLLLAAGWWLLRPGSFDGPAELAMANFEPYPNIAYQLERGGEDDAPEKAAFVAYEGADYAAASQAFAALPATPVNKFYLGQSLLAQGEFSAAANAFRELTTADDFNLRQESEYYLALALTGSGETEAAVKELNNIVADAGHPLLQEAKALLKDLR